MPTDACQFFYTCENCNTVLKPTKGDCCVYYSYGNVSCPPIQKIKIVMILVAASHITFLNKNP
tara:strand:- start:39078 stop:39266 length:189 start_codon:yes stop_codon:yes gene_type:complete